MKLKSFFTLIHLLALLALLFFSGSAQAQVSNDANVFGRLVLVSKHNNALIVKVQAKAIHKYNAAKILMLASHSLWLRYNDSIVAYAETPVPASDTTLTDGDFFYPSFNTPYYGDYTFNKKSEYQPLPDAIKPNSRYVITHVHWEGELLDTDSIMPHTEADVINDWIDVSFLKLSIIKTGEVQLKWGLGFFENEILDEESNYYEVVGNNWNGLKEQVTFIEPVLQLSSSGQGIDNSPGETGGEDPYIVNIKSTNASTWEAGTLGFHIYFNSDSADFVSAEQILNNSGKFEWGPGTLIVNSISNVTNGARQSVDKDGREYNSRITFINNDRTQADDIWLANSSNGIDVLSVIFNHKTLNVWTYLETIDNEEKFKNWTEGISYPSKAVNASRNLGLGSGASTSPAPLPVSLISFTAGLQGPGKVVLKWATASEMNNEKFVVERSANGAEFIPVATVAGKGTSNNFNAYSAVDNNALAGVSYYRLKQVDFDGRFEYSKIIAVTNSKGIADFAVKAAFPNPFRDQTTLDFTLPSEGMVTMVLTDIVGKTIRTKFINGKQGFNSTILSNTGTLPNGVYFIKLSNSNQQISYKLLKQ